jgi:hypothetical protein
MIEEMFISHVKCERATQRGSRRQHPVGPPILIMTPMSMLTTLPPRGKLSKNFAGEGNFAKEGELTLDSKFAKEGNFIAERQVCYGRQVGQGRRLHHKECPCQGG